MRRAAGHNGGGGNASRGLQEGGSGPPQDWPIVPAVVVAVLLAALLTWLGMYAQLLANLAGARLPGS